ncbi:hypothetical protein KR038_004192 [Drosophila bunnanda]|nr:hypothetical protein KR038_004192 [Drosophila bunnanda]
MFDRTVNAKFKTSAANAGPGQNPGRRNSMLTPAKGASVGGTGGNIRKLTKVNSLTRDYAMCYGPNIYQNSNNAGSNAATLQRTTSESLRLNSLNRVSRASSNTSLATATATSTSTSLAPKSSSSSGSDSNATPQQQQQQSQQSASRSRGSSGGKASSPNNNGARAVGGAAAATVAGPAAAIGTASHHHQPHHHHHHHHHHQYHHHQQQQQHPHQTSLSQGHASLTVAGGASGSGTGGGSGASSTTRKPKTTSSFEITSVTVGHPKLNAAGDTGDESADDLDESHTDDNSRITDLENETPSMSEDTFSKEEVYYANNALSTNAPVIPTSSQYGLVVVDPIGPSLGQTIQNVQVNVSDNIINVVSAAVTPGGTKKKDDIKETQHRSERFKVVKIESTEPFKRGRWMCMDYLDHSSVGSGGNNNEKTGSSSEATTDGVGGSDGPPQKTTQSMILPPTQKLNENHLEANSTDANWNYAEQQSQQQQQQSSQHQHQQHSQQQQQQSSHQQQQPQMSATPSGVMTAPATVVHGMHQLHMEAQQQQQQQQLFDSVNANASSPNPQSVDTGNMGYALTAAMQLQQTLQQLKQREEAMESGYQNGGDVAGGAPNNNNSGGGGGGAGGAGAPASATTESQLSTTYVEQQQPLSPAPQTPQITPTFAAVAAGQAAPNFQLEQQPQATSQIDGMLPQSQFPQQQQTPQQSTPQQQAPPAVATAAAAAAAAASAGATAAPATQQQTSNTSNAAVTTGQGQTLPLLSHMTSYEQQPSAAGASAAAGTGTAATSSAVAPPAIPTLHLQSAPATIADPQQLMVPQQQQEEHQQQQQQIPPTNIASASANNSNLNLTNPNVVANAEPTKNALTLTDEQVTAATTAAGAGATSAAAAATSTSAAMQLQQLQQQPNAESETESFNTFAIPGGNRKRAFSNPHIGIIGGVGGVGGGGGGAGGLSVDPSAFMHRLNPQLYYYNKSQSGRSSFCVDESLWPTNPNPNARASDTNLYMGSSTEEDYEEAIDQFSPTLYTRTAAAASRAIPIPTSAGNSPQHQLHPQLNPHQGRIPTGINSAAFSASPSIYAYPHSPFYASSPETSSLASSAQLSGMQGHPGHSSRISFSYDPAFQRLQVAKTRSPLECASVLAAVAAAATCGDAQQMGLATPCNSASGTSAVAIDNKIEQAMDLVKSHLMIAVREEVEVLKERISELMDKINKLEVENTILKSHIPQETLQQIQMQLQIAGSQQPAAVAAPPATPAIQAPPPTSAPTAAGQAAAAAAAGAVSAVAVGSTGAPGATSPASVAAPTSIPNGSAENGAVSAVTSGSGNNSDASAVEQVTAAAAAAAAAAAVPTVNGPMS